MSFAESFNMPTATDSVVVTAAKHNSLSENPCTGSSNDSLLVNEMLCYAVGMFVKTTAVKLKTIISSFYSFEELSYAKEILINCVEKIRNNLLQRYAKRKGENRSKLTADDIYDILSSCDENNILGSLPKFVAMDIDRIPTIRTEDIDVISMALRIKSIESRISLIETLHENSESTNNKLTSIEAKLVTLENRSTEVAPKTATAGCNSHELIVSTDTSSADSWASVASDMRSHEGDFTLVNKKKSNSHPLKQSHALPANNIHSRAATGPQGKHKSNISKSSNIRFLGSSASSHQGGLKSGINIMHKAVLHVDNLDAECSETNLRDFLSDINVKVVSCFPAKSWLRGDARDLVCAYRVCIDAKDKVTMCSATLWPQGVIVRDWVFKPKPNDGVTN
jgi:hypothetical protein